MRYALIQINSDGSTKIIKDVVMCSKCCYCHELKNGRHVCERRGEYVTMEGMFCSDGKYSRNDK